MYGTIGPRLEVIKSLSINNLSERQPLLVALLADLVNHETQNGELTAKAGNKCLESMDWWPTLTHTTQDAGFQRLGNGHFSAAYSHEMLPGKVIKVGFKKEDSGAAYVAFCRMHQGREGIPVIHDVQRHAGCYTVVMDHLEVCYSGYECINDRHEEFFAVLLAAVECSPETYQSSLSELTERGFVLRPEELELLVTAGLIREFFHGIASFDMHKGNAMVDPKTGKLVITDPVSFSADNGPINKCADPMNPDELIKEIQEALAAKVIAGAKRRKKLRDRMSTECVKQREIYKAKRKAVRRGAKHWERQRAAIRVIKFRRKEADRLDQRVFHNIGRTLHGKIWLENPPELRAKIHREMMARIDFANFQAMQWGMPLGIDIAMQAGLMG